ncbi:MAG: PaaI family thioesterase [Neisseria sp.]|nr:PaaI family thioesterase [Neisseria sp.]
MKKSSGSLKFTEHNTMQHAFQDDYAAQFSHCYGCGYGNAHGLQLKSYWDGEDTVARFTPNAHYSGGVPHHVYGGLMASLLDCHGTASAYAAYRRAMPESEQEAAPRFVTAQLNIRFRQPAPMGAELTVRAKNFRLEGRKVWLDLSLSANGAVCAEAQMLAVLWQSETFAKVCNVDAVRRDSTAESADISYR